MSDTDLQLAKQRVSEMKQRILKQHAIVLGLRREGGIRLENAVTLWESLKDELIVLEDRLDRLVLDT
jgi:hypothetical protein